MMMSMQSEPAPGIWYDDHM